jgi:cytochrome c peroxidase
MGVRTQTWSYGSPADCLTCHTPVASYVLGVNTRQLNGTLPYPATGVTDNQIRTLNRLGMFSPAIDEAGIAKYAKLTPLADTKAPLQDRARALIWTPTARNVIVRAAWPISMCVTTPPWRAST